MTRGATKFSPTVSPPMIVAPAAIHTFLSITMGFAIVKARRRDGSTGWPDVLRRQPLKHGAGGLHIRGREAFGEPIVN
jgi:hypothetical protein